MHLRPQVAIIIAAMTILFACTKKKDDCKPSATVQYRSLQDEQVKNLRSFHLDVDLDRQHDVYLALGVTTGAEGTRGKFFAAAINGAKVLAKDDSTICLQEKEIMKPVPPHPRNWKGMESYMVEAFIPAATPNDTVWTGNWLDARRQYIGVQFTRDNVPYIGWVCVSMDRINLALILHGCAWRPLHAGDLAAGLMPGS